MNIFRHEWRKCVFQFPFCLLFAALVCANAVLFVVNETALSDVPASGYRLFFDDVRGKPVEEAGAFLAQREREARFLMLFSSEDIYGGGHIPDEILYEGFTPEEIQALLERYRSGNAFPYTGGASSEYQLLQELQAMYETAAGHARYLQEVQDRAEQMKQVSIFAEPGTFTYRNIAKTAEDFAAVRPVEPSFDNTKGLTAAVGFRATDFLALFVLFYLAVQLVSVEKDAGAAGLIKTTVKGRGVTAAAKAGVLLTLCAVVPLVFYTGNFLISGALYGFGDGSLPMQLVWQSATLPVTLGKFVWLFWAVKFAVYALVGLCMMALCMAFAHKTAVFALTAGLLGLEALLYAGLSGSSPLQMLKYGNVVCFLDTSFLLGGYVNLNVFGFPVLLRWAFVWIVVLGAAAAAGLFGWLYVRRARAGRFADAKARFGVWLQARRPRWRPGVGLVRHESYKYLWMMRAGLLMAVFAAVQILLVPLWEPTVRLDELYYDHYMQKLEGPLNDEKDRFLQEEEERFAQLHRELAQGGNAVMLPDTQRQLDREIAFREVLVTRDYLRETGGAVEFVRDLGYQRLAGQLARNNDRVWALLFGTGLVAAFASVFSMEEEAGMRRLLTTTKRGRGCLTRAKLAPCAAVFALMFAFVYLPPLLRILTDCPLFSLGAPARSLPFLSGMPEGISLCGYLCLAYGARLAGGLCASALILFLSARMNTLQTLAASGALVLLPLLLTLIGVPFADKFLLNPLLLGNSLFQW